MKVLSTRKNRSQEENLIMLLKILILFLMVSFDGENISLLKKNLIRKKLFI